jgi:hypothetical protein
VTIVIFLGPSLPLEAARAILPDALYLPPVKAGDVCAAVEKSGPSAIGIIDGVFEQVPSVWHKEILFALSKGVRVWGASSMGALRAAELHPFGMEGVGEVFDAYRRGEYTADDEVALLHASAREGFRPISEALVNIRAGLRRAEAQGLISALTHSKLLKIAREQFYPDRSWRRLREDGRAHGIPEREIEDLYSFVTSEKPNIKREDAEALLRTIAAAGRDGFGTHVPQFEFEPTDYWRELLSRERRKIRLEALEIRKDQAEALVDRARLTPLLRLDRGHPIMLALLCQLLDEGAHRRGIVASDEVRAVFADRLRVVRPDLGEATLLEIARLEALAAAWTARMAPELHAMLPVMAHATREIDSTPDTIREDTRRSEESLTLDDTTLLKLCRERFDAQSADLESLSLALGFSSVEDLRRAIVTETSANSGSVETNLAAAAGASDG